ncbi:unnamed protein product [Haemonchus placei]|uniref:Rieske domain-containing protein n=1 Tax=Haemonchus placei TaxID=6290 RepID=A0A0N4WN86_HAEPC|nr:unnamed protein product [Haemonchus placei]
MSPLNPTKAARMLLDRDVFALAAGGVLMVVLLDHNVVGTCYAFTPARIGKVHYSIQPGTRDLIATSPQADNNHSPFGIYNDDITIHLLDTPQNQVFI